MNSTIEQSPQAARGRRNLALIALGASLLGGTVFGATAGCSSSTDQASGGNSLGVRSAGDESDRSSTIPTPPDYRSWIANVRPQLSSITIFDAPAGQPLKLDTTGDGTLTAVVISNPLPSGAPATFRVKDLAVLASTAADSIAETNNLWHEVYLPSRPNESVGWVLDRDVTITHTDLSATVSLSTHTMTLTKEGKTTATYPLTVGAADTPTPTGHYFVRELIQPSTPDGAFGPLAYGLSAFTGFATDDATGGDTAPVGSGASGYGGAFFDGAVGIQGTNEPDLVGQNVSNGNLRMNNDDIIDLESHAIPLGMPVDIVG